MEKKELQEITPKKEDPGLSEGKEGELNEPTSAEAIRAIEENKKEEIKIPEEEKKFDPKINKSDSSEEDV